MNRDENCFNEALAGPDNDHSDRTIIGQYYHSWASRLCESDMLAWLAEELMTIPSFITVLLHIIPPSCHTEARASGLHKTQLVCLPSDWTSNTRSTAKSLLRYECPRLDCRYSSSCPGSLAWRLRIVKLTSKPNECRVWKQNLIGCGSGFLAFIYNNMYNHV